MRTQRSLANPPAELTQSAYLDSCSTSAAVGVSPSPPRAPGNSSNEVGTALAAAHDSVEPHLNLHACSVRRLMRWGSPRASLWPAGTRSSWSPSTTGPPTSRAITNRRARRWTPTSSGYVRAFLFRAASKATPSTSAAPLLAVPSHLSALTNVVSIASCAPPNWGRPSATTSRRLPPGPCRCSRSRSRTMMLVVTRPPASRQILASMLSKANPRRPRTPALAHAAR